MTDILPISTKFTIDEHEYCVEEMLALPNLAFAIKMEAFFGDGITSVFSPHNPEEAAETLITRKFSNFVHKIALRLEESDKNQVLLFEILKNTTRDGVPITRENFNQLYKSCVGESIFAIAGSIKHTSPLFRGTAGLLGLQLRVSA